MSTGTPAVDQEQGQQGGGGSPTSDVDRGGTCDVDGQSAQDGQSEDVQGGECLADPLKELQRALEAGEADAAWMAYTALTPEDRSSLGDDTIEPLVGLLYPSQGLAAIQQIFGDFAFDAHRQVEICERQQLLDAELAYNLVNTPGVTAAEQELIATDVALMPTLVALVGGTHLPHELFAVLAADDVAFIGACGVEGPLADWVGQDDETLEAVTDALPNCAEWTKAFEAHGAWDRLLRLADSDAAGVIWREGLINGSGYGWVVEAADKPIADNALAEALFRLYGDGSGVALDDKYKTWEALYNARLVTASEDLETASWNRTTDGWQDSYHRYYHGVAPNDESMNLFFSQFKVIPRVQIDLASTVIMCDYRYVKRDRHKPAETFLGFEVSPAQDKTEYQDKATATTWHPTFTAASQEGMRTSYYTSGVNAILMQARPGGAPSKGEVVPIGVGAGRSDQAVTERRTNPDGTTRYMYFFENHATHEVGHAVGNKRLVKDGINATGDDTAKAYGGWAAGGDGTTYARELGWTAAMDATNYALTVGATTVNVLGRDIRLWLVSRVSDDPVGGSNGLVAAFSGSEMAAIESESVHNLKDHELVKTVKTEGSKNNAFRFRYGIPSPQGGKVVFFCTRGEFADQWTSYDYSAWDERVSHYSVSSYKEMFAEIYTEKYTSGNVPAGMQAFFDALDTAEAEHFPDVNPEAAAAASPGASGEAEPQETPWPS